MKSPMSPELLFLLTLLSRMAITAAFVVTASIITERSGPVIGALVATLPISAGPSYVFLALDHDAAFIAEGALASLPINAATIFLGLTYVVLAQRHGALVSCLSAVAVWIVLASIIRSLQWTLLSGLIANAIAFAICVPLLQHYRHVKMPMITRRWYDIPLRASLVATLVATVVTASGWVGPKISGIIALFPIVFTSMMLILHPPHRRAADRGRARQQRRRLDGPRHRHRRAARRGAAVWVGDRAEPGACDLYRVESLPLVVGAAQTGAPVAPMERWIVKLQ